MRAMSGARSSPCAAGPSPESATWRAGRGWSRRRAPRRRSRWRSTAGIEQPGHDQRRAQAAVLAAVVVAPQPLLLEAERAVEPDRHLVVGEDFELDLVGVGG